MPRPRKYAPGLLLDRGARLVVESGRPRRCANTSVSSRPTTACGPDLPTAAEREEIKALRRENYELRRANEILRAASVFFATDLDQDRTT
jgi:transposase